jgi:peroxiredoxin
VVAVLAVLLVTTVPTANAEGKPPTIGVAVSNFGLKDIHRRSRSLNDFKDKQAVVVVFLDTECPVANLYVPTLIDLHKQYADKGVQFLAINASNQDSFVSVAAHAQEREIPFPVLKDFDQTVADAFGVKRTPEVFLLDSKRVIRYHGRVDDQYGIGVRREKPTRSDLKEAIDELLVGKAVTTSRTEATGCVIERAKKPRVSDEVTYARHVAPILQKRCQECHRPGEIGPFSLLGYEDAKKRTGRIREALVEQRMPPWHADPRHGKFLNDRRLTQAERDTLLEWIDTGATKGDDKDLPPVRTFAKGWKIGEPEKIFMMEKEFKVPAAGVLNYQRFVLDPEIKEDVWVQAAECRPGNRAVVHHILIYMLAPGKQDPYSPDGTATVWFTSQPRSARN